MKYEYDVMVVGGGASGLVASIVAAREGSKVAILEKMNRVGKKILTTGNGRCNLTNINCNESYFHGQNPKFVMSSFNQFSVDDTLDFFRKLGIESKVEDNGKVYPYSNQASSVLDVLRYEIERLEINEICEADVIDITKKNNGFELKTKDGKKYLCKKVIVTTGGKSSPNTGSNGKGYDLVKKYGHTIIPTYPVLVQVKLDYPYLKRLKGVKFDGKAKVIVDSKVIREEEGEILFADYGISGPPILQLSREVSLGIDSKKEVIIEVDMFCNYSFDEMKEKLQNRMKDMPFKTPEQCLIGLVNKRLIQVIILEAGIDKSKEKSSELSNKEVNRICNLLKKWRFKSIGTNSWMQAQCTAGGIKTSEINPKTMESKKIKGMFLAGEIIDIDGDCGGFNLQWAWSSGYVAGKNASK